MEPDGSNLIRLTNDEIGGSFPRWSPDGNTIAFMSGKGRPGALTLNLIDADGKIRGDSGLNHMLNV